MSMLRTEHEFVLPMGYLDGEGTLHREGVMRLATAADEILPLRDGRVERNPAYLTVILLSRVIVRLGSVEHITPQTIEGLFAGDLAFLQELYDRINQLAEARRVQCPECAHSFEPDRGAPGGSRATPSIA
jgi:hypothetical protein